MSRFSKDFDEAWVARQQAKVKPMGPLPRRELDAAGALIEGKTEAEAILRGNLAKANKYGNTPTIDEEGIRHASKKEQKRWKELRLMLKAGQIDWLARQVEFILPGGIIYRADFVYFVRTLAKPVIEDAKGMRTEGYRLKKRLMAERGFEIKEV